MRRTSARAPGSARPCEKCPGATSCTVMPGSVVALNTSSHSSMLRCRPGLLGRGDVVPGRAVRLAGRRPGTSSPSPSAATRARADQAHAVVVGHQVMVAGELDRPLGPVAGPRRSRPAPSGWSRTSSRATSSGGPPGVDPSAAVGEQRACSRSRSASACSASLPRSTGIASALLISAASAGTAERGVGVAVGAARSMCATRRACAASAAAAPDLPESPRSAGMPGRQSADAAEQRLGDRRAAPGRATRSPRRSTARPGGQVLRRAPRRAPLRARSPCRSRPGRARRGAGSGCAGAAPARRRRPVAAPRPRTGAPRRARPRAASPPARAVASRASPAADAGRGQVLRLAVVLVPAAYSRTSATSRSQTARTRGERSMRQTLP